MTGFSSLHNAPGSYARAGRAMAAVAVLATAFPAHAQGIETALGNLGALGGTDYLFYAILAFAVLVGFIILTILVRKFSFGKREDPMAGLTYLDVTGLKKTGLLTDEEAARVRQAMKKQVALQQAAATRPAIAGEVGLLTDPEVQRLEAIAESKARAAGSGEGGTLGALRETQAAANQTVRPAPTSLQPAGSGPERPVFSPRGHNALTSPDSPARPVLVPSQKPTLPGLEFLDGEELGMMGVAGGRSAAPAPAEDAPLPPDVVKMAELGLITPEELERIKDRIRQKRNSLG